MPLFLYQSFDKRYFPDWFRIITKLMVLMRQQQESLRLFCADVGDINMHKLLQNYDDL